jgi:GTP-binding protein
MKFSSKPFSGRRPVVSLVGRPNVGKSTLFNRVTQRRTSIVHDEPGVTRDRMYAPVDWLGHQVRLIDTGGLELGSTASLMQGIIKQTKAAIDESDVIVLMVDAPAGIVPIDYEIAEMLRRCNKPVVIAVNKSDSDRLLAAANEFFMLGFDTCIPISAAHGRGLDELFETVLAKIPPELLTESEVEAEEEESEFEDEDLPEETEEEDEEAEPANVIPDVIPVAVIGKPNAGKSSFVNKLLGEERHLVSDEAGTTIDAVDSFLEYGGQNYQLIDTAGIRKKRSISRDVEKMAVSSSLGALDRCAVAIMLIDATAGLTEQDMKVAAFANNKSRGLVIVVNKWDLAREQGLNAEVFTQHLRDEMPFLSFAPIRFVSALTGSRVFDVLEVVSDVAKEYFKRVSTGQVNRMLEEAVKMHAPPVVGSRRVKIFYASQVSVAPPTFLFTCNDADGVHFSYRRYLTNQIRETFGFKGAPVRMVFRGREKAVKK